MGFAGTTQEEVMKKGIAAAMAAMVFAGCATTSVKVVDKQALDTLKPGVTTIAQVEATYGPPFQETKEPDGTDQLQYVSKIRMRDDSQTGDPIVGSNIRRQIEKNVSSMLVFDQRGHFLHAWTSDKTVDENVPGNLGKIQPSDVTRGSLAGHGI
jgi:outer membrane protein assembly factor BamE (lipoprotein component of BamABCDE complex)